MHNTCAEKNRETLRRMSNLTAMRSDSVQTAMLRYNELLQSQELLPPLSVPLPESPKVLSPSTQPEIAQAFEVFYSYSKEDEGLAKKLAEPINPAQAAKPYN